MVKTTVTLILPNGGTLEYRQASDVVLDVYGGIKFKDRSGNTVESNLPHITFEEKEVLN